MQFQNKHLSNNRSIQIRTLRKICLPTNLADKIKDKCINHSNLLLMTEYAVKNGLAPLFRSGLVSHLSLSSLNIFHDPSVDKECPIEIESELVETLNKYYFTILKRNFHIQSFLEKLDKALSGTDIKCILWKGASLIQEVYPEIALRPMEDIDILISNNDLEKFKDILMGMGYKSKPEYPLTWQYNEIIIDLHTDVVHGDRISGRLIAIKITTDKLAIEAIPISGFNSLVTLSPHDHLICMAVHALKHGFNMDIWLADAFYLIDKYPDIISRPEKLSQRAIDLKATFPLYILISLLEMWPQNLDLSFVKHLYPARSGFFTRHFLKSLSQLKQVPNAGEIFYIVMIGSFRKRLLFLLETMFPSRLVMKQLYPNRNIIPFWFYYPHRLYTLTLMFLETTKSMIRLS